MLTSTFIALIVFVSACGIATYVLASKLVAKRQARQMSRAISTADQLNRCVNEVPSRMVPRELRRALVLILNRQIETLTQIRPDHPHGWYLENRLRRLNQLPTGFEARKVRSRGERKQIGIALEQLAKLVRSHGAAAGLTSKEVDIAAAGAEYAHRQIAVESIRQAVRDAENVRAFPQALSLAYQAKALCSRLPPRAGDALRESVTADVQRLEAATRRPAGI